MAEGVERGIADEFEEWGCEAVEWCCEVVEGRGLHEEIECEPKDFLEWTGVSACAVAAVVE